MAEDDVEAAIKATSDVTAELVVVRGLPIQARGYFKAVRRLRNDVADETEDVYLSLVEAINWLSAISESAGLQGDLDVRAVRFVRNRAHHHFASTNATTRSSPRLDGQNGHVHRDGLPFGANG